ncbi:DUF7535 family protein [Natronorarus salvus]|uniref:DUF7535 family protein n=1 Tax=Natronorarus salvus TaxID=3117733 RepID=UPI002F268FCF
MSETTEDPSAAKKALRTVTPPYRGRPDAEMTAVGAVYFLTLLILLVPLLPFLLVGWLLLKLFGAVDRKLSSAFE